MLLYKATKAGEKPSVSLSTSNLESRPHLIANDSSSIAICSTSEIPLLSFFQSKSFYAIVIMPLLIYYSRCVMSLLFAIFCWPSSLCQTCRCSETFVVIQRSLCCTLLNALRILWRSLWWQNLGVFILWDLSCKRFQAFTPAAGPPSTAQSKLSSIGSQRQ